MKPMYIVMRDKRAEGHPEIKPEFAVYDFTNVPRAGTEEHGFACLTMQEDNFLPNADIVAIHHSISAVKNAHPYNANCIYLEWTHNPPYYTGWTRRPVAQYLIDKFEALMNNAGRECTDLLFDKFLDKHPDWN